MTNGKNIETLNNLTDFLIRNTQWKKNVIKLLVSLYWQVTNSPNSDESVYFETQMWCRHTTQQDNKSPVSYRNTTFPLATKLGHDHCLNEHV